MGDIYGAMIITPIIAGALFAMRLTVAIVDASASMKKQPNEGIEARTIASDSPSVAIVSSRKGAHSASTFFQTRETNSHARFMTSPPMWSRQYRP